ncbi:MAG: zinc ABC transporter substrate-binding protein [Rhodobacter sp.]|uniref:zinc ABC transporter substrate-binding protein n=1 Tax=Pararhodobacter sp. TaxID=2127056 RepID=UPI001DC8764A|nr:zinc ABC transporter substrate-binding protein [Pararhodobacter sp.]MCB1345552.1 zinc ABC transporter substrate-binding protein [Paracoccaceae bacterium]MCC0071805.1 zinc ABC transporter substrate-binding protein [Rhodobacter sp.]HPD91093.1 zinc ABC transporter substrate-binding protein [Pararhodobacter sp.]
MILRPALIASILVTPALAQPPRVAADTPIVQSLAAQVLGDLGTPDLLLDRGADPHHAQLRPSQARALSRADLVLWSGEGMTPWLERPLATLADGTVLDLDQVAGLRLQPFQPSPLLDMSDPDTDEADHDHDYDHEGHHHEGTDPHVWLDPQNAIAWLDAIAARLAALDPANAATYRANADAAAQGIRALRDEIAATLAPASGTGLVMSHDAYGYFATAFPLTVLGTISLGDASDPGAARLARLRAALAEAGPACLFPESNHPARYVALIAEGTALRIGAPLDPAGTTLDPGPDLYAQTLRALARAIADCAEAP